MADPGNCLGITVTGDRCSRPRRKGSAYCAWHDPDLAPERDEWRRRGGKASSNKARAQRELAETDARIETLPHILFRALDRVEKGEITPGVANAIASLARTIIAVNDAVEVERRLTALEHMHGDRKGYAA